MSARADRRCRAIAKVVCAGRDASQKKVGPAPLRPQFSGPSFPASFPQFSRPCLTGTVLGGESAQGNVGEGGPTVSHHRQSSVRWPGCLSKKKSDPPPSGPSFRPQFSRPQFSAPVFGPSFPRPQFSGPSFPAPFLRCRKVSGARGSRFPCPVSTKMRIAARTRETTALLGHRA